MRTPEEHRLIRLKGEVETAKMLIDLAEIDGFDFAESNVFGMVEGIRRFLTACGGDGAAYELLQRAADRAASALARVDP